MYNTYIFGRRGNILTARNGSYHERDKKMHLLNGLSIQSIAASTRTRCHMHGSCILIAIPTAGPIQKETPTVLVTAHWKVLQKDSRAQCRGLRSPSHIDLAARCRKALDLSKVR
jgi:hypothetical protein